MSLEKRYVCEQVRSSVEINRFFENFIISTKLKFIFRDITKKNDEKDQFKYYYIFLLCAI